LHALRVVEIVDGVTRLAAMNLLLHGVGPTGKEAEPPVKTDDSLRSDPNDRFDLVLTNPPFGKKLSVMVVNDQGEQQREALEIVCDDLCRHLLAQGRQPGRLGQPGTPRRDRRRDC
jgi:type I restriction enzyme M protein